MNNLYCDVIVEILKFEPHWTFAFINHEWAESWKTYTDLMDRALSTSFQCDLAYFYISDMYKPFHQSVSGHISTSAHFRSNCQSMGMIHHMIPRGINPYLTTHCDACHQSLSHAILNEYALLAGINDELRICFHIIAVPVEVKDVYDFSRNDPCQHLISKRVFCDICARIKISHIMHITKF